MDNKNNQNKSAVDFTNLKALNKLMLGNELNGFVANLKQAKLTLDTYCKGLKEHSSKLEKQKVVPAVQPVESIKPTQVNNVQNKDVNKVASKSFVPKEQFKPNNNKSNYNNNFNKDRSQRPQNNNGKPQQGGKPAFNKEKDNKNNNGPRQLGPKSTFVARGEVVSFVPKPDNKKEKKQKTYDTEKKGLNIKAKIRMGVVDFEDEENEDRIGRVRVKNKKSKPVTAPEKVNIEHAVITTDNLTVKKL